MKGYKATMKEIVAVKNCLKAVPVIRRREMSEEQRQAARDRMKKMQGKKV